MDFCPLSSIEKLDVRRLLSTHDILPANDMEADVHLT